VRLRVAVLVGIFSSFSFGETLGELLQKVQNNDSLVAQRFYEERALTQKKSLQSAYYPKLEATLSAYKKANAVAFEPREVKSAELTASLTLFDGFKREERLGAADKEANAQKYRSEFVRQTLSMEVIETYYAYFDALARLEALDFKLQEVESHIKKLTVLVTNDLATKDSLEAMNAAQKESLYEKESAKLYKEEAKLRLELLTGAQTGELVWSPLSSPAIEEPNRLDITADKLSVESLRHAEGLNTYLPTLILQGGVKKSAYSTYDDMGGMQKQFENNAQIGAQLNWTLFDFGAISKDREAAKLQTLAAAKNLAYKENSIKIDAKLKAFALNAAKARLQAAEAALTATETAYSYSKKRFEVNLIGYTDFLTELSKKQDAISRAKAAKNEVELAKAHLAYALGVDITTLTHQKEKK